MRIKRKRISTYEAVVRFEGHITIRLKAKDEREVRERIADGKWCLSEINPDKTSEYEILDIYEIEDED